MARAALRSTALADAAAAAAATDDRRQHSITAYREYGIPGWSGRRGKRR